MACLTGIEPVALNSGGLRSIQLSYKHARQPICSKNNFLSNNKTAINCHLTNKILYAIISHTSANRKDMKLGKLYGVGIGSGNPEYLTLRACKILKEADTVFTVISQNASDSVSKSVVEYVKPQGKIELLIFSMAKNKTDRENQVAANANKILEELEQGKNVAFATLGDAMTYSTFGYVYKIIKEKHPDISIEIIPGINSFTTLSAISQKVLAENRQTIHVIPSFKEEDIEKIEFPENSTTILLKTYRTRETLLKRLQKEKEKHPGLEIIYGEHLGLEGERLAFSLEEIKTIPETYLSMIMVKK